ncbi:MAG: amidohydrolase family protein [Oscillospiraceae bacterium]|nr:amidohydrolase family protein [Oscillospiraceae bacterium]
MRIIDAHIHRLTGDYAAKIAREAGHENTESHLRAEYERLGITGAVVMGNRTLELEPHSYPDFMRYCIGLDSSTPWISDLKHTYGMVERHLQRAACVGVKIYPGYNFQYVYDKIYYPVYELAGRYDKPVAIHTGETAFASSKLKYCHPLTVDEVAADFPRVKFVICHLGNPWFVDAAAVINKNPNVCADLSGMLLGKLDTPAFFNQQEGYIAHIRTWLEYMDAYDRMMFGTDWPIVNIRDYVDFISLLIPEKHREKVFADNARRIYGPDF